MTEVVQPKLHPDYIRNAMFGSSTDQHIYDEVNALGGRREGHSYDVANIWEEENGEEDEKEERVRGNAENPIARDSGIYEAPLHSSAEPGSDLDRFVEDEFQFLDSEDDGDGPLLGRRTIQQTEELEQFQSPPLLANLSDPNPSESAEEALSSGPEEPVVASRSLLEPLDVYEVSEPDIESSPPIPAPPPLPPAGLLLASSLESPETTDAAGNVPLNARPKDRPKNEPQSPENHLFLELQGKLNRRLRKIDEGIERNREAESSLGAAAAVVPMKLPQESFSREMPSDWRPSEQTDTDRHHSSFLPQVPDRAVESDATEKINSVIHHGTAVAHVEDSRMLTLDGGNTNLLQDSESEIEGFVGVLPVVSDGGARHEREESSGRGNESDFHRTAGLSSEALLVTGQVDELEFEGEAAAKTYQTEVEERLEIPGYDTIPAVGHAGNDQLQPVTEAVGLHPVSLLASVPDVVASAQQHSTSVRTGSNLIGSSNESETNPVVKRAAQLARPRPSSSGNPAVHFLETPSGDEWTPQMDLMDDEFEEDDDFPLGMITSRRHLQKRQPENIGRHQRQQKRTPSKLYQKKQLGGPQLRPLPNQGAFSLARINKAVKRVFGSISSKPSSKQRAPISDSVFLQEDGWEIYPARPYDQSNPGESIQVVEVEKRPAYAYNAFTRQLVILPDHDRILVTSDGRRIRDPAQPSNSRTTRPTSPGRNTSVSKAGKGEKPHFASKSKASNPPRPPNLNTKTVKSIHMHGRPELLVEDAQMAADDDAYWRRNSSPNFAGSPAVSVPSPNLSKKKTSTISKILSFRRSAGKSTTANGLKSTDERR